MIQHESCVKAVAVSNCVVTVRWHLITHVWAGYLRGLTFFKVSLVFSCILVFGTGWHQKEPTRIQEFRFDGRRQFKLQASNNPIDLKLC